MIRTLVQSLLLRLPGGLVRLLGGWQVKIALAVALILGVAGVSGWAYHKGAARATAMCEARTARADALRRQAEIAAAKDADLLAEAVRAETARERGPAEVLDRLRRGTF